jgi:hypothetical protein
LDFDKAASIWSQFEQGLVERISVTEDTGKTRAAGTKFGVPGVAAANLGVDYLDKRSTLESKILHHDVLNRIERRLLQAGLVTDLSAAVSRTESSAETIRSAIGHRPYLQAEGAGVVEDYRRILLISEKFNELAAFIIRSNQETFKQSAEYKQLQKLIADARDAADRVQDRNEKARQREQAKEMQRQLEMLGTAGVSKIDQWLVDGIRLWISTFMPTRINFRIYPFANCPAFQVLCNLKRDCFVDADLDHLLYGYGNRPNVPLAVFGLVTSLPGASGPSFDPMKEFEAEGELSKPAVFEKAFRGMFGGVEGIEIFMRYSRYPNVTVHPIAVYRSFPLGDRNP